MYVYVCIIIISEECMRGGGREEGVYVLEFSQKKLFKFLKKLSEKLPKTAIWFGTPYPFYAPIILLIY